MYTKEEEIIHFVFLAFKGLKRKKENIDLAFHSIMVGNMLKNIGCVESIVYTGYLHDIIEDTKYTYDDLLKMFGKNIADSVLKLSENKNIRNYVERKNDFLKKLKTYDNSIIIIEIADKLQNLISDYDLYLKEGKKKLATEANDYNELRWYYGELKKIFESKKINNLLLSRFNDIYNIYFKELL